MKGCFDINECDDKDSCAFTSGATCTNGYGDFQCSCPGSMEGSGNIGDPCVIKDTCDDALGEVQIVGCENGAGDICFQTCKTYLSGVAGDQVQG